MGYKVDAGSNGVYTFKNKTFKGIHFATVLEANAVNVQFVLSDFNAAKIMINIILRRNGIVQTLFNGNMALLIANHFFRNFEHVHPKNGSTAIVHAHGAADKQKQLIDFYYGMEDRLNKVINLEGEDEVEVSLQFPQDAQVGANILGSTTSYIDIVEDCDESSEYFTPYMKTYAIKAGETNVQAALGSNILELYFVNLDKDDVLNGSSPLVSVNLSSDKIKTQLTYEELMLMRQTQLGQSQALNLTRRHTYCLYRGFGEEIDDVIVNLSMTPGNVNTGMCYLVYWTYDDDAIAATKATSREQIKSAEKLNKLGLPHNIDVDYHRSVKKQLTNLG